VNKEKPSRSGTRASGPENKNLTRVLVILAALTACAALVVAGLLVYAIISDRKEEAAATPAAAVSVFTLLSPFPP